MRFVVDSDVFLHDLLHTERANEARDFLDGYVNEICTTAFNIMEIGSVLSRKYRWKKEDIDKTLNIITKTLTILIPTEYDIVDALEISRKYYLTPIDALMLVIARNNNSVLVTFDKELLSYKKLGFNVMFPPK